MATEPAQRRSPLAVGRLRVARLSPADADDLAELFERNAVESVTDSFDPFPLTPATAQALTTAAGHDRFLGGRLDGRLVAFAMLRGWDQGFAVPSFGVLVDVEHQGRGIGRAVTEWAREESRGLGCPRLRLSVYRHNLRAHGLYVSLGFREVVRRPPTAADPRERIVMELELDVTPIPVAAPALVGNELAYVKDCLESTWIAGGPYIARFERAFADFCEVEHAVSCCNGTAALHLALLAAGVEPGDEVILPALTYVACANAIVACGAVPVLADVDRATWNLDPVCVAAAVTPRTRAILAVHLYGHPADMDALRAIADRHDLLLIEDAAEAHGARYRGRVAGSVGDVAAFSFFGNKILTTGEGGMVVTSDAEIASKARLLAGQGQDPGRRYWHVVRGFNYRMTNVAAAIGVAQLERAEYHLARRHAVARSYRSALAGVAGVELAPEADWARSAHWMTAVHLTRAGVARDDVIRLLAEHGIDTRPFFPPIHLLPPYADAAAPGALGVSEELGRAGLCLPTFADLDDRDVERVALTLDHVLRMRAP